MAKQPLQDRSRNSLIVRGYAPVEELGAMRRECAALKEGVDSTELTAAIEAKVAEIENTIRPIADEFNFPDLDRLIQGIHRAFMAPDRHNAKKLLMHNQSDLIEALNICSKEMQSIILKLGKYDMSYLALCFDGKSIEEFITTLSVDVGVLERLTNETLDIIPEERNQSKRKHYWQFVRTLAYLWKAEIKEKPKCNHSIAINDGVGGYTGEFYKFVTACTKLDRAQLGVGISNGSTIKNVLKEWSITNPM